MKAMAQIISASDPIMVEFRRGSLVESRHRCHAVIMTAAGEVVRAWGDPALEIFPRSAIKPIQALALLETGAADHYRLTDERIALATASHAASQAHVMTVEAWLDDMDLGEGDLECGAHMPYDEQAAHAMIKRGEAPCRIHNNCSGKHAGFLTTARHMGEDTAGYLAPDHPVQRRLYDALTEMGDCPLGDTARGVDGCGIPVYGMALGALARSAARMADPKGLGSVRRAAAERITAAMAKHPFMVSGRGRFDTVAMTAGVGRAKRTGAQPFVTKTGAEAVHTAILPEKGWGIALKVEDGAKRASDAMMAHLLDFAGVLDDRARADLSGFLDATLTNAAGAPVGAVRPAAGWDRN
ncbi:MAG: asparaginase [Rhodospirillaceae bacterium]